MNTNKEMEWRRFIVPKKVEQINDHLFMETVCSPEGRFVVSSIVDRDVCTFSACMADLC